MREEETQRLLGSADKRLIEVADGLIDRPFDLASCSRSLESVVGILDPVSASTAKPVTPFVFSTIRRLQKSATRVQELLDCAASFYCGSICAAIPIPETYTPDGEITRAPASGYLQIEA